MTDTAQAPAPAETEVVPASDPMQDAMQAFKVHLGQEEAPERARDEKGRFTSQAEEPEEEIEAPAETEQAEEGAESQDDTGVDDQAADEVQPEAADLPTSWPADKAELWQELSPDAQAFLRQRDEEQSAAVNAKFMEAANLRKAHEAEIGEAQLNRQRYAEANGLIDQVLSAVQPRMPPLSMLDVNSSDYDPDRYHLFRAQAEDWQAQLNHLNAQRQQIAAQERQEEERQASARYQQINGASRDAFIKEVPDVTDQAKAAGVLQGLMDYAIAKGAPADLFQTPTTALEWHVLWKAREYDRLQEAKGRVAKAPIPEPRKPQPAVRPGVTTPRSAIDASRRKAALDRLKTEGSVEAGAAALKHLFKGHMS